MPILKPHSALRSVTALGVACGLAATVAACSSIAATSARTATAQSSASAVASSSAPQSSAAPSASAPVAATSAPASTTANCASSPAAGTSAGGSITVCPDAAPVGAAVHVTIAGCAPTSSDQPAAALFFLGPDSWLGTDGGGNNVNFAPQTGYRATATFTIPATNTGGNENGPYPTLTTKPGHGYEFATDPAGECSVHFTVLSS
jgi:hypothetical protein